MVHTVVSFVRILKEGHRFVHHETMQGPFGKGGMQMPMRTKAKVPSKNEISMIKCLGLSQHAVRAPSQGISSQSQNQGVASPNCEPSLSHHWRSWHPDTSQCDAVDNIAPNGLKRNLPSKNGLCCFSHQLGSRDHDQGQSRSHPPRKGSSGAPFPWLDENAVGPCGASKESPTNAA